MERSEKREKGMLSREQEEEENEEVLVVSLRQEDQEELEVVQQLLRTGADMTLCNSSQQTALHVSPPELQGKVLGWMSRPHLPPQAQLLQAAWQGDLYSLQNLLEVSHTDAASMTLLALDKYSCEDLDSEFGDSDVELDLESLYPNQSTAASPTHQPTQQHSFLLYSHTGEVLDSPGYPLPSDHHKELSQDKGIPLCFQNAMETLRDIRQAYQDTGRGSRGGLSLPSLNDNSRRWSHLDLHPSPLSGLLSTRTTCLPVPPSHRQRTRSVVAASPSSPGLLSVVESSQLSQSAPSIMEPLLCSNTMIQARAHVQSPLTWSFASYASQNTQVVGATRQKAQEYCGSISTKTPCSPEAHQPEPPLLQDPAEEREAFLGEPTHRPADH
ncbi:hypothetical protein D5F01_LYC24749 [Larimichthys crocea]|uniref:Uncharacterized protein n=1 Tax=Larimichthys crocea TaxID=215358 RepID=A0A6G0HE94_LARCR|nr:hypothetical protein D5F01_LYC24749 [Larimichthys crocea]